MKRLTLENKEELESFIKLANYEEYNSNIVSLFMWQHQYEIYFETSETYAICMSKSKSGTVWLMPYCLEEDVPSAILAMKTYSEEHDIPFVIYEIVSKFQKALDHTLPNQFYYENDRDLDDYVYLCEQHRTLQGKKMQKRRNHFHAFEKEYEGRYTVKQLEEDDIPTIYAYLDEWIDKHEDSTSLQEEKTGIHYMLDHFHELPLFGTCIYIDEKLEAFCIQSLISDNMMQCHVEKANRDIRGLYVAIVKFSLDALDPSVTYFNREDDMGLESLRKAKQDMKPAFRVHKMIAYAGETTIRKATVLDLAQIKQLWAASFQDETQKSTSFFFRYLFKLDETYVLTHNTSVISMLQTRKVQLSLCGEPVHASFIVGVATRKTNQECGYMHKILTHVLSDIEKEEPITILQAYHWDLYRPYGFELLYEQDQIEHTTIDTNPIGNLRKAKGASELSNLYKIATKDLDGHRIRDEEYYKGFLLPYLKNEDDYILVHTVDDLVDGYFVYEKETNTIIEWISIDQEASDAMLSCLKQPVTIRFPNNRKFPGNKVKHPEMMIRNNTDKELPDNLWIHEFL